MSFADGHVLPKPQVPKTLGILNIIFGVLLFLFGSCMIAFYLIAPSLQQYATQFQNQVKSQAEARRQAQVKSLEEREKAAASDEEKASLKAEREALVANPVVAPPTPDLQTFEQFKHPVIRSYTIVQAGSAVLWDIALIVSGIGLVRLRGWARTLASWLAGIQLVRLALLVVVGLVFVLPVQQKFADRMMADLEAKVKAGTANPTEVNALQTTKVTAQFAPLTNLAYGFFGAIYPAISLWLLNTAGARAACRPAKPEGYSDLPGAP